MILWGFLINCPNPKSTSVIHRQIAISRINLGGMDSGTGLLAEDI